MNLWKDVLVDWINCTKFMNREFFGLKKISVTEFFRVLRETQVPRIVHENVLDLIKEQYPQYDVRPKGGHIEEVFIWSLLLHYTCVKVPCDEVRTSSNHLGQSAQMRMASFFTVLLSQPQIDRQSIHLAITEASELSIDATTPKSNLSFAESIMPLSPEVQSSTSSTNPSPIHRNPSPISGGNQTPIRTNLALVSGEGVWATGSQACTTPRTKLLDDWNSENRHLKAQIESERDERLFVEGQLKQQEERIEKLVQEKKALTHDLLELKNSLNAQNMENISPNKNHNEAQVKRRLYKEIADKEKLIEQLSATVEDTQSTNASLRLRVEHADKQVFNLEQRSVEQMHMFEEQHAEIKAKEAQIEMLKVSNLELESYLREIQRKERESTMDMSIECVDSSFVSNLDHSVTASSSAESGGSPQNLAHTVVEVQLREQQMRNQLLLEQFESERQVASDAYVKQEALVEAVQMEMYELRKANDSMKTSCQLEHMQKIVDLGKAIETLQQEHDQSVSLHHLDLESARTEATELMDQVTRLNSVNQDLVQQIGDKDVLIDSMNKETQDLIGQKMSLTKEMSKLNELVVQLGDNLTEHQRIKCSLEAEESRLHECTRSLQNQVEILTRARESLTQENVDVRKQLCEVQVSLKVLTEKLVSAENKAAEISAENQRLSGSQDSLQSSIKIAETHRDLLESELANLKTIHEDQILKNTAESAKCMELAHQLAQTQTKLNSLESENVLYRSTQADLEGTIQSMKLAASTFEKTSHEMGSTIAEIKKKYDNLLQEVEIKNDRLKSFDAINTDMSEKLLKIENELKETQETHRSLQSQFDKVSEERNDLRNRSNELNKKMVEQHSEFDQINGALRQEIANNEESLLLMRTELTNISESLSADCKEIEQLKNDKLSLTERLEAKESELGAVSTECQLLGEQHKKMSGEFLNKLKLAENLEKQSSEWKSKYIECSNVLVDVQSDNEVLAKNLKNVNGEMSKMELRLSEKEEEAIKLNNDIDNYTKQINDLKENHLQTEEGFSCKIDELEKDLRQSVIKNDEIVKDVDCLKETIAKLNAGLIEAEHSHKTGITSLQNINQELETRLAEKDNQIQQHITVIDDYRVRIENLKSAKDNCTKEHELSIQLVESKVQDLEKELANTRVVCSRQIEEINSIEEKLLSIKLEREALVSTDIENKNHINELEMDIVKANEKYQLQLNAHNETTGDLNRQVETLNVRIADSESAYDEMKTQFDEKKDYYNHKVDELMLLTEQQAMLEKKSLELELALQEQHQSHSQLIAELRSKEVDLKNTIEELQLSQQATHDKHSLELKAALAENDQRYGELIAELRSQNEDQRSQLERIASELQAALEAKTIELEHKNQQNLGLVAELRLQIEDKNQQIQLLKLVKTETSANVDALKLEIKSSKCSMTEVSKELEQQRTENELIENDRECVAKELSKLREEKQSLNQKMVEGQEMCLRLEQDMATHRDKINEMQVLLEKSTESCSKISDDLNCVQDTNSQLNSEKELLAKEMLQLRSEFETLSVVIVEHEEKTVRYEAKIEANQLDLIKYKAELQLSTQMTDDLLEQLKQSESTNVALTLQISKLSDERQIVQDKIAAVTLEFANSEALICQLNAEKTILKQQISELTDRIQMLEAEKEEIAEKSAIELVQAKAEHKSFLDSAKELQDEIEGLQQSLRATEADRERLSACDADQSEKILELTADFADQNRLLMQQTELITQKSSEIQSLRQKLDEKASEHDHNVAKNQHQMEVTLKELEESQAQLNIFTSKVEELNNQLESSLCKNAELSSELEACSLNLNRLEEEKRTLTQQLNVSIATSSQLEEKKSSLAENVTIFEERIKRLEEERDSLVKDAISGKENIIKMENLEIDRISLRHEYDQLMAILSQHIAIGESATKEQIVEKLQLLQNGQLQLQSTVTQNQELNDQIESLTEQLTKTSIRCDALERKTKHEMDQQVIELQHKLALKDAIAEEKVQEVEALMLADAENTKSNAIIRAKLIKERELTAAAEKAWQKERQQNDAMLKKTEDRITETRSELEGKLEKMKSRMKSLYTDESRKIKTKHDAEIQDQHKRYEQQLFELKSENHTLGKQISAHETHIRKLSNQIFQLNDQALELKTSNEAMKTKLRFIENNPHAQQRKQGGRDTRMLPSSSMSSLHMEDEEGEQFCNTYLDDLLTGRTSSISGRSSAMNVPRESASVPLSELKMRNSMLPQHLRSSYAVQYADQYGSEDDIKGPSSMLPAADDSMFSTQSEPRRGTLYQKPGPPTPSKNGGRLSFGGGGASGRLSMDPSNSSALTVRHEPNTDSEPTKRNSSDSPPPGASSKLRSFFGGGDKSSRRGDELDYYPIGPGRMSGNAFHDHATSTPIKQWPRRDGAHVQRTLTVRNLDPILITSTFFDSAQLNAIASYSDTRRSSISPDRPMPLRTPAISTDIVVRRKEPRKRDTDYRKSNREKARQQRIQLFNNARKIFNEHHNTSGTEVTKFEHINDDNHSYTFTVSTSNNNRSPTFEKLFAERPCSETLAEESTMTRFHSEATLSIHESNSSGILERTNSTPSFRTRNVSAMSSPSFGLGVIPRRLDRSFTPLQNSRLSTDSMNSNSICSVSQPSVANDPRSKLLVTTVSLLAIGYAWLHSLLEV